MGKHKSLDLRVLKKISSITVQGLGFKIIVFGCVVLTVEAVKEGERKVYLLAAAGTAGQSS